MRTFHIKYNLQTHSYIIQVIKDVPSTQLCITINIVTYLLCAFFETNLRIFFTVKLYRRPIKTISSILQLAAVYCAKC